VDEARGASRSGGFLQAVLGVPLFYKLLVANSLVVIFGAVVGTAVTAEFVRASPERSTLELVGWLAAIGTLISVGVNAAIIRWALELPERHERDARARGYLRWPTGTSGVSRARSTPCSIARASIAPG
jgi:hypothetical protein